MTVGGQRVGIILAAVFFVVGCLTIHDYGTTWDEFVSLEAGRQNLRMVYAAATGGEIGEWPWQELTGYQFVFDTVRVGFGEAANDVLFQEGSPLGFHLFNLLLSSSSLWLLYRLALELTLPRWGSALALLSLAAFPKFIGHSQNNPKDLIGLFCTVLALLLMVRAATRPPRASILAGMALGLAFASHVVAVLLVPLSVAWLIGYGAGSRRERWLRLALQGATAVCVALAAWPWLWGDPVGRVTEIVRHTLEFRPPVQVFYLGQVYPQANPPWHYSLVMLLVATPVILVVGALIGACRWRAPAARFASLWVAVVLGADLLSQTHYGGVRHLLSVLPAIALLAAVGFQWALDRIRLASPLPRTLLACAFVGGWLFLVIDLGVVHPYYDAYLNSIARRVWSKQPEYVVELEVWGSVYKEGAEWLAENAEPGSTVVVPIATHCARPYLRRDLMVMRAPPSPAARNPIYLMFMTRVADYTDAIRRAEALREPVFTVKRHDATLLKIYRLQGARG